MTSVVKARRALAKLLEINEPCKTKDTDDFPDLKDKHNERCYNCLIWEAIDELVGTETELRLGAVRKLAYVEGAHDELSKMNETLSKMIAMFETDGAEAKIPNLQDYIAGRLKIRTMQINELHKEHDAPE